MDTRGGEDTRVRTWRGEFGGIRGTGGVEDTRERNTAGGTRGEQDTGGGHTWGVRTRLWGDTVEGTGGHGETNEGRRGGTQGVPPAAGGGNKEVGKCRPVPGDVAGNRGAPGGGVWYLLPESPAASGNFPGAAGAAPPAGRGGERSGAGRGAPPPGSPPPLASPRGRGRPRGRGPPGSRSR